MRDESRGRKPTQPQGQDGDDTAGTRTTAARTPPASGAAEALRAREVILERRKRFVAAALTSLTVGCNAFDDGPPETITSVCLTFAMIPETPPVVDNAPPPTPRGPTVPGVTADGGAPDAAPTGDDDAGADDDAGLD